MAWHGGPRSVFQFCEGSARSLLEPFEFPISAISFKVQLCSQQPAENFSTTPNRFHALEMATFAFKPQYTYVPTPPRSKSAATRRRPAPKQDNIFDKLQQIRSSSTSLSTPRPVAAAAMAVADGDGGPAIKSASNQVSQQSSQPAIKSASNQVSQQSSQPVFESVVVWRRDNGRCKLDASVEPGTGPDAEGIGMGQDHSNKGHMTKSKPRDQPVTERFWVVRVRVKVYIGSRYKT
jgi:hypothetical protein